jgi:sigma-B regulation protein RsbU (phosphoserine phosphatase)
MEAQFARLYRAALLDYLLGNGAVGLDRAYELGRRALETRLGLLRVIHVHDEAVATIVASTSTNDDRVRHLSAAREFLSEALAPFEMTYRGYVDLLNILRPKR